MDATLQGLIQQLKLEVLEVNLFRGQSTDLGGRSVFGGQVIGQALVAAASTVEGRVPHSLHAYFLAPGDVTAPIVYEVDRLRDGKRFTARRVQAVQHGQPILSMIASFQVPEAGAEHQTPMPSVPDPDSLASFAQLRTQWMQEAGPVHPRVQEFLERQQAMDFRPVEPMNPLRPTRRPAQQAVWFRTVDRVPDDPLLHRCMLAYASDYNLVTTALLPHALGWITGEVVLTSLDHALWFHHDVRIDEWLLYVMDSPAAQGARGLARGLVYNRAGKLVASVAQEGLMRARSRE